MNLRSWWNGEAVKQQLVARAREAAREAATFMGQRAVDYAPVDTGFLASHIQVIELANDLGFRVVSTAFYSAYQEFGFLTASGTWVPPKAFMRRALAETAQHFPEIVKGQRISTSATTHNPEGFLGTTFDTAS